MPPSRKMLRMMRSAGAARLKYATRIRHSRRHSDMLRSDAAGLLVAHALCLDAHASVGSTDVGNLLKGRMRGRNVQRRRGTCHRCGRVTEHSARENGRRGKSREKSCEKSFAHAYPHRSWLGAAGRLLATLLSNGHSPESLVSVATPLLRSLKDHGERNVNSRSSSGSVGRGPTCRRCTAASSPVAASSGPQWRKVIRTKKLVGAPRFELGTPSPPDWCANRAALRSENAAGL